MNDNNDVIDNLDRRKLLASTAAVAASVAASGAFASAEHHHHKPAHAGLVETALDCIKTGEACTAHCLKLVKNDDNSIADCLSSVSEMMPMCRALATLASTDSKHLYDFAQVCMAVCKDCEEECAVHKDMHPECKVCMESCTACIKECEKLTA